MYDFALKILQNYGLGALAIVALLAASAVFSLRMTALQADMTNRDTSLKEDITTRLRGLDETSHSRYIEIKELLEDRARSFAARVADLEKIAGSGVADMTRRIIANERDIKRIEDKPALSEENKRFRVEMRQRNTELMSRIARIESYIFDLAKEARSSWPWPMPQPPMQWEPPHPATKEP